MSLLWRKPFPICQVHKHNHCISHLSNSYLLKDSYTWNGPGSRGQRTHISTWTLRAPLVSIHSKILNLSLKALKDRFSATKKKCSFPLYFNQPQGEIPDIHSRSKCMQMQPDSLNIREVRLSHEGSRIKSI